MSKDIEFNIEILESLINIKQFKLWKDNYKGTYIHRFRGNYIYEIIDKCDILFKSKYNQTEVLKDKMDEPYLIDLPNTSSRELYLLLNIFQEKYPQIYDKIIKIMSYHVPNMYCFYNILRDIIVHPSLSRAYNIIRLKITETLNIRQGDMYDIEHLLDENGNIDEYWSEKYEYIDGVFLHRLVTKHEKGILKLFDLYFNGKLNIAQTEFLHKNKIKIKISNRLTNFGKPIKLEKSQQDLIVNMINLAEFFVKLYFDFLENEKRENLNNLSGGFFNKKKLNKSKKFKKSLKLNKSKKTK